jgi:hypothetical protein
VIGAELRHLLDPNDNSPVVLGGSRDFSERYAAGLAVLLGQSRRWLRLPPEQVERATVAGHAMFLGKREACAR